MIAMAPTDFSVLGEDDDFLAVGKPAGLLVHPTRPGGQWTLWDGLKDLLGYELVNGGQVSIMNRLDRETSGVVVVAKSKSAARMAGMEMEARRVEKRYLAVVFGWPDADCFSVEAPIVRRGDVEQAPVHLERMVHPSGDHALTELHVLHRRENDRRKYSVIEAFPHTGRTHQIRVHLAHAGYPVLGDKLYAKGSHHYLKFIEAGWTPELESHLWLPRHALHCAGMSLAGRRWACPVPDDLAGFFPSESLRD
jgi:23S rRNA pseudouridine1911/1915/1917 synthase